MLSGWAYFRNKVTLCKKNIAKVIGGRILEVGVFSRDYGTAQGRGSNEPPYHVSNIQRLSSALSSLSN